MAERWRRLGEHDKLALLRALVACQAAMSAAPPGLYVPDAYRRLFAQVLLYTRLGNRLYRQLSDRRLPLRRWGMTLRTISSTSARELSRWHGLTKDRPMEGMFLRDFQELMRFGRLQVVGRQLLEVGEESPTRARVLVRSLADDREMWLYVDFQYFVRRRSGPPCPYCGVPLRTPRARQCGACRMDWHDPENVFRWIDIFSG